MVVFGCELLHRGYSVELIVANLEGALQEIIPERLRVVNLGSSRMIHSLPKLIKKLRSEPPKAIFSTITHANLIAACAGRLAGLSDQVVVRQSSSPLSEDKDTLGRKISHRLIPPMYRRARAIIAVSEGVRDELIAMDASLRPRIQVLPTPVLTDDIRAKGDERPPHRWFVDRNAPVIVSAGRLVESKGMVELLQAHAKIRARREAKLIIIGEGGYRAQIEAEIQRLGLENDVDLPGFQSNPFSFMSHANVFAFASHFEGLPNVLVQAMSFGTPIVSTDCKSGPAEILEGGMWGTLVPVKDVAALAHAIDQSLDLPKQSAAQRRAWERFGAAEATSGYLAAAGLPESV
jgi:glycosyltransferase involved in cell wall biosynthesis